MNPTERAEYLAETYADAILRLSYTYLKNTHDAQDVCQTVFVKLLTEPRDFESPAHERAYVLRMAANACKDLLKSPWRKRTCGLDEVLEVPAPEAAASSRTTVSPSATRARSLTRSSPWRNWKASPWAASCIRSTPHKAGAGGFHGKVKWRGGVSRLPLSMPFSSYRSKGFLQMNGSVGVISPNCFRLAVPGRQGVPVRGLPTTVSYAPWLQKSTKTVAPHNILCKPSNCPHDN